MGKVFLKLGIWGTLAGLALLFVILTTLLGGLVLQDLWGWFIVPLGVMQISIVHAIGISLVVRLVTYTIPKGNEDMGDTLSRVIASILYLLAVWGIGFIVHLYM